MHCDTSKEICSEWNKTRESRYNDEMWVLLAYLINAQIPNPIIFSSISYMSVVCIYCTVYV